MKSSRGLAWLRVAVVASVVFLVDQLTKWIVRSELVVGERRDVLGPLDIVHVRNSGVAFGALSGRGWVVPVLTLAALVGVVAWFALNPIRPLAWLPTGMVLGGALGNLIDRLDSGAVTDFIKIPHWPAFNAADISITAGVIVLVLVADRATAAEPGGEGSQHED